MAVAAPIDDEKALLMWYLTKSPEIDARIRAAGWEVHELYRHDWRLSRALIEQERRDGAAEAATLLFRTELPPYCPEVF